MKKIFIGLALFTLTIYLYAVTTNDLVVSYSSGEYINKNVTVSWGVSAEFMFCDYLLYIYTEAADGSRTVLDFKIIGNRLTLSYDIDLGVYNIGSGQKIYFELNHRYITIFPIIMPIIVDKQYIVKTVDSALPNAPIISGISGNKDYLRTDNNTLYVKGDSNVYTCNWSTATDVGGSGIANYQYQVSTYADFIDNTEIKTVASSALSVPFSTTTEGSLVYVKMRSIDNVGNISLWSSNAPFIPDNTQPSSISVNKVTGYSDVYPTNESTTTTESNPVFIDTDEGLVFSRSSDSTDTGVGVNPTSYNYITAGVRRSRTLFAAVVNSSDYLGNSSTSGEPFYYYVDKSPPTFDLLNYPPVLSFVQPSADANITTINMTWTAATDNGGSGVKKYNFYYKSNNAEFQPIPATNITVSTTALSATINVSSFPRDIDNNIAIAITAVDNLNRESDKSYAKSILLPAKIKIHDIVTSLTDQSNLYSSEMQVKIYLDITKAQASASYSQIQLYRLSGDDDTPLPSGVIDSTTVPWDISKINSTDCYNETIKVNGVDKTYMVCVDRILASTGAGHKKIKYYLNQSPILSTVYETVYNNSRIALLPNHPGKVNIVFTDMKGNKQKYNENGEIIVGESNPDFKIQSDARVDVSFEGKDLDNDYWVVELDRTKKIHANPDYISYQRLNRKDPSNYSTSNTIYNGIITPVTLYYNTNTLVLMWNECTNSAQENKEINQSKFMNFSLAPDPKNGFTLNVGSEFADYGPNGIKVHPGEELKLVVSNGTPTMPSCTWFLGDKNDSGQENTIVGPAEILHKYHQQKIEADQTEAYTTYPLKLVIASSPPTEIPLTITVEDTLEGELFEPELWRGDHRVTGVVQIPAGMYLKIGSSIVKKDMKIEFEGGVGAGYKQGILVKDKGSLIIDNGVNNVLFTKRADQLSTWGTIRVEAGGTANIGNASTGKIIFEYADRAITATKNSILNIKNSIIRLCTTGLQIFGSSTVNIINTIITGNTLYGLKEENNALPTFLSGNHIFNNIRNYYKWNLGLLNTKQINDLSPNMGTSGE